jgi:hypothetical protein
MKTTNLILIGGAVVLGGFYLYKKSKKDKAEADVIDFGNGQLETFPAQNVNLQKLPAKEATVYALKTIADVNSLLVKFPPLKKDEFLKNYNNSYRTKLFLDNRGNITDGITTVSVNDTRATEIAELNSEFESERRVSDANRVFNSMQMGYTRWKLDFATVYSDLKDYFSTLSKEQAEVIIKYLPKAIVQSLMGDNDPRVRANNFYSQEEIIDIIDNKLSFESILTKALPNYSIMLRQLSGFGNITKSEVTIEAS